MVVFNNSRLKNMGAETSSLNSQTAERDNGLPATSFDGSKTAEHIEEKAPEFAKSLGRDALRSEANAFYIQHISKLLYCAEKWIPPEERSLNSHNRMLSRHCADWRLSTADIERNISYYYDNIRTRSTNHYSKEATELKFNTPHDVQVEMKTYLFDRYSDILKEAKERCAKSQDM
jgi:hypothetical protein